MGEIYVNKEAMCKLVCQILHIIFWLISVFVRNAKGGDCWNYDIFVISANT